MKLPSGRVASGPRGAVAAGHPLAAAAGLRMLEQGGNAIDAVLAAALMAWVVMPDMCGLGGDCFVLSRDGAGNVEAVTGAGPSPAEGFPAGDDLRAHLALTPGAPAAFETLRNLATLPLDMLLAPAIRVAEAGFVISPMLARKLEAVPQGRFRTELLAQWGSAGAEGQVVRWPIIAETLRDVAADPRSKLLQALPEWNERDVLVAATDVAAYRAPLEAPLETTLGGWRVFGQPPMSQAVATLAALGRAGSDAVLEPDGPFRNHMLIEAYKQAFAGLDRFGHAEDVAAACRSMLDPAAMRAHREAIGPRATAGPAMVRNYGETTQCAAVDASGRVATLIHSLYRPFGARVISPSTGLIANDRGASFTTAANAAAPGVRPRHTLVNVLAVAPDGAAYALGTPGAQAQTQTNLQVLARLMSAPAAMAEAVLAPRWSFIGGKRIACEADMPEAVMLGLQQMGHEIGLRPPRDWLMGSVSLAAWREGLCHTVADDRRAALALAT